jgi:hypothetical protein
MSKRPTVCGVQVHTWGSKYGAGNGMLHYLDSKMFGGNVGHAAITLIIPANSEGDALIAKYCQSKSGKKIIPYAKKSLYFADGSQEDIYEIRFSWWPPRKNKKTSLEDDINIDRIDERYGIDFPWSEEANTIFKPESRIYKGLLGKTVKLLGPLSVVHIRDLDENKLTIVKLTSELVHINESLDSLKLILSKLEERAKNPPSKKATFYDTEIALIKNVMPELDFENFIGDGATNINISKIKKHAEEKTTLLSNKKKEKQHEIYSANQRMRKESRKNQLQDQIYSLKSKANKISANSNMLKSNINSGIITQDYFDDILTFEDVLDISFNDWKNYVKNPDKTITTGEIKVLLEILSKENALTANEIKDAEHELQELNNIKTVFNNIEDYMTLGALEDNSVTIPIKIFPNSTAGVSNGLDYDAMLKQMNILVTDNTKFDLQSKNCSETVGKILEAGVQERHLKEISKNRAWGAFGNPQMVYNTALRIQKGIINHERSSILRRVINFNPVQRATGAVLKVIIDKKSSRSKKIMALFLGIFVGALELCSAIIRSIFNPLSTFKAVYGLISYAYSKESNALKTAAIVILGPILLTVAIPAAIQLIIIATIITPIRNLLAIFSKKENQSIIHNDKTNIWHRLKTFNPAAPIERAIKSLIVFGRSNHVFIPIIVVILIPLLISAAIVNIIAYPFNMLGSFMTKESRVNIVDHKDIDVDTYQSNLNIQRKKQAQEQELKELIEPRIKEINVIDPIKAILEFAADLKDKDAIPVFSNKSIDKLKKYMRKHNDTPEYLIVEIKQLNLDFPKKLNYKNLSDLVDALQLLSAQRVTESVKILHDTIKHRKTTETTKFTSSTSGSENNTLSKSKDPEATKKPKQ